MNEVEITSSLYDAVMFFTVTLTELSVLFLLVSGLVSVLQQVFPADRVKQLLSGRRGYTVAVALGAVTPFCSCSTLPMTIGLIQARAAFGPVMSFLLTSPLLNPFIVTLFAVSFGAGVTLIYSFFVLSLSILLGMLLQAFGFERFIKADILSKSTPSATLCVPRQIQWRRVWVDALGQFKAFIAYMILGVGVGAWIHGYVPLEYFAELSSNEAWWLVPVSALLGVVFYVRASTMVPIAASLVAKGASMGAVMALSIGGAGASLPEMIMMKRMFHLPLIVAFVLMVFFTAIVTGYTINLLGWG